MKQTAEDVVADLRDLGVRGRRRDHRRLVSLADSAARHAGAAGDFADHSDRLAAHEPFNRGLAILRLAHSVSHWWCRLHRPPSSKKLLLSQRDYKIIVIDNLSNGNKNFLECSNNRSSSNKFSFYKEDIRNKKNILDIFNHERIIDTCIHLG